MRPARILADVTANSARFLARRIRDKVQTVRGNLVTEMQVDDTRLDDGAKAVDVDLENVVHLGKANQDPAIDGNRSATEAGAGATSGEGLAFANAQSRQVSDLRRGRRKNDRLRPRLVDRSVILVKHEIVVLPEDIPGSNNSFEMASKGKTVHARSPREAFRHDALSRPTSN
jgi:hypothetical protein